MVVIKSELEKSSLFACLIGGEEERMRASCGGVSHSSCWGFSGNLLSLSHVLEAEK